MHRHRGLDMSFGHRRRCILRVDRMTRLVGVEPCMRRWPTTVRLYGQCKGIYKGIVKSTTGPLCLLVEHGGHWTFCSTVRSGSPSSGVEAGRCCRATGCASAYECTIDELRSRGYMIKSEIRYATLRTRILRTTQD